METADFMTLVEMPDNTRLEVIYYCKDNNLKEGEKKTFTQLYIQLYDCICSMKIAKSVVDNAGEMERIVHNKVISERGHLC